ncbi:MAG: hypothetical protein KDJ29_10195, partial [Hyphomicrobiales bacterium]|nr:hypothetical protein [Hyphomicrobiales bacterium]
MKDFNDLNGVNGQGQGVLPAHRDFSPVPVNGHLPGMPQEQSGGASMNGADIRVYLMMLVKHRYLIAVCTIFVFIIGLFISLLATRYYTATATVQIDEQVQKVVSSNDLLQAQGEKDFLMTQLEVLKSRKLAERAAGRIGLERDPGFLEGRTFSIGKLFSLFRASTDTKASEAIRKQAAVNKIIGGSNFNMVRGTRIVRISFTDKDPGRAQRAANALADAFIQFNLDRRIDASSYARTYLQDQLGILRTKLEESETALVKYAEKKRIIEVEDKASLAAQNLEAANVTLGKAIGERIKAEYLWKQANNTPSLAM